MTQATRLLCGRDPFALSTRGHAPICERTHGLYCLLPITSRCLDVGGIVALIFRILAVIHDSSSMLVIRKFLTVKRTRLPCQLSVMA